MKRKYTKPEGWQPALKGKGRGLLWLKANVSHQGDECLIWPWSGNHQGYGQLGYFGKVRKAHHIMCLLAHGERPTPKHHAAHSCGNGHLGCVNPRHLSWKTPSENCLDTVAAGRHGRSGRHLTHLTPERVKEIKAAEGTQMEVAAKYGVSYWTIGRIRRGETWKAA